MRETPCEIITRILDIHFCPRYLEKSAVGMLESASAYFSHENFQKTLQAAIAKREQCKATCEHFDLCLGACPMEEGCGDFPALFAKNAAYIDCVIAEGGDLGEQPYVVAKLVIKDIAYGE